MIPAQKFMGMPMHAPHFRRFAGAAALSVSLPVLLFLLVEAGLRVFGYGAPSSFFLKPKVQGLHTAFENPRFGWRFFPPRRARTVPRLAVPVEKPAGVFRIFVLGESAAMGNPDFSFGFARILDALLAARRPGMRFEIHNTAMAVVNSHVVRLVAAECARLDPDLFIVLLGNNEVVGPYGAGSGHRAVPGGLAAIRLSVFLNGTRTGQFITGLMRGLAEGGGAEREWGGMEMFVRNRVAADDPRLVSTAVHFQKNLEAVCRSAASARLGALLCTVPVNLRDCAPFASVRLQALDPDKRRQWEAALNRGIRLEQDGNARAALEAYSAAALLDGAFADLQFRIGRSLLALGRTDSAAAAFARARDLDAIRFRADSEINRIIRAVAAAHAESGVRLVDAEERFRSAAAQGVPGNDLFWEHVHTNFHGSYTLAASVLSAMDSLAMDAAAGPVLSESACAQALALTRFHRYAMAAGIRNRMLRPPFTGQLTHTGDMRRIEAELRGLENYRHPDSLAEAESRMRRAIGSRAFDWVLHENLGKFLLQARADAAGAETEFRAVLERLPFDPLTHNNLGAALAWQGDCDSAGKEYIEALRLMPVFQEAAVNLAVCLEKQGRFQAALEQYKKTRAAASEVSGAASRMGQALASLDRKDEALSFFREAVRLDSSNASALNNLGAALLQTGDPEAGGRLFEKALAVDPKLCEAHLNLGALYLGQDKPALATDHFLKALEAGWNQPALHNDLGVSLTRQGLYQEAVVHFREALKQKPDFTAALNNLAGALVKLGRPGDALPPLTEAVRLSPGNPELLVKLGDVHAKLEQWRKAADRYRKALEYKAGDGQIQDKLDRALEKLGNR
jgi:tetratricopeptide (TPR) repeat protein